MENFNKILNFLENEKLNNEKKFNYFVPGIWINSNNHIESLDKYEYFIDRFKSILSLNKRERLKQKIVYNMLLRYTTSFPHNNGIDFSNEINNYLETGSILKAISILPYIHSLGCNTLYLLPMTSIGIDNRKGNLGSPYAIRNHYKLDENLSEPFLQFPIEDQFKALVEACHYLGIKVILEFVFRTSSVDCDMALLHPEWFYWIKAENPTEAFKPPVFDIEIINEIQLKINQNDLKDLPKPDSTFLDHFVETPIRVFKEDNKIYGKSIDGTLCRIPSAFADWPPDDNQPLWSDVTYLKLFNHTDYNYIAYNTIRMYDEELTDEYKNIDLWNYLSNIIPFYQKEYSIDGVMIDMGHALPQSLREEIIHKSRISNDEFILWEENFSLSESSIEAGYDASLGYVCFDAMNFWKMKEISNMLITKSSPIEFFLTPETHNTHRTAFYPGDIEFSKLSILVLSMLPGIQFIHSGIELGEKNPVNTGLGFHNEELLEILSDELPLFSKRFLSFKNNHKIIDLIKIINSFKYSNNLDLYYLCNINYNVIETEEFILGLSFKSNVEVYYLYANYSDELREINLLDECNEIKLKTNQNISMKNGILELCPFSGVLIK
jgi:starch synthase (maltosyl-transferring)